MNRPPALRQPALRLLRGHTTHQRSAPFRHRFRYGLAMIEIDIDRLEEAGTACALFSTARSNLFSFRRRDHGERLDQPLRPWALAKFEQSGIDLDGGSIRLVTFPRHAFYKFAPISLWLGHGPDGVLRGILYEVNNTFGETHTYGAATPQTGPAQHSCDKAFHVSPFFDVSGRYRFTLRRDTGLLSLVVETLQDGAQVHVATIMAKYRPASTAAFARLALAKPLSSLAVTTAIHWQALKLLVKGARYHAKPLPPDHPLTLATATSDLARR